MYSVLSILEGVHGYYFTSVKDECEYVIMIVSTSEHVWDIMLSIGFIC